MFDVAWSGRWQDLAMASRAKGPGSGSRPVRPGDPRVSITDVAREAGVAISTVSAALNGRDGVSAQTRERVAGIAQQLGWVPSIRGRSLVSRQAYAVGLLIQRPASVLEADPFFAGFIGGVPTRRRVAMTEPTKLRRRTVLAAAGVAGAVAIVPGVGAPIAQAATRLTNLAHLDELTTTVRLTRSAAPTTYRLAQQPDVGMLWVYADVQPDGSALRTTRTLRTRANPTGRLGRCGPTGRATRPSAGPTPPSPPSWPVGWTWQSRRSNATR